LIMLIDKRFTREDYRELYPPFWRAPEPTRSIEEIREAVSLFWGSE
ncbi:MAG: hypothetical protein HOH74_32015, partial [Gemmatimonadetes bacterium]|nr:hypothetical protein [Gemmatimonadota bacterium]